MLGNTEFWWLQKTAGQRSPILEAGVVTAAPVANPQWNSACCSHRLPQLMAGEGGSQGLLIPSDLLTAPKSNSKDRSVLDKNFLIEFLFHLI